MGHETTHTTRWPKGNATPDAFIAQFAADRDVVVISKDSDFFHSFLLRKMPPKLVLVKIGNMRLRDLRDFFAKNATVISDLLQNRDLVKVYKNKIVAVEQRWVLKSNSTRFK